MNKVRGSIPFVAVVWDVFSYHFFILFLKLQVYTNPKTGLNQPTSVAWWEKSKYASSKVMGSNLSSALFLLIQLGNSPLIIFIHEPLQLDWAGQWLQNKWLMCYNLNDHLSYGLEHKMWLTALCKWTKCNRKCSWVLSYKH